MAKEKPKRYYKKLIKKISKNYWAIATIVLAIILLIVLIFQGSGGISGNVISKEEAGEKLIEFAKSQGADASLVEVNEETNFYEVIISIDGQILPVYVTKDGEFLAQLIPLEAEQAPSSDAQNQQQPPQNVPKSDKPVVELFIMSFCPYGTQAQKGILPVIDLLKDKIDFKMRFVYYAMHGKQELDEQLIQHCIQKEQSGKFIAYLKCFLKDGDTESCLSEIEIDKSKLNTCVENTDKEFKVTEQFNDPTTWLSGSYPLFDVDKDLNEQYNIGGSPTLVINGQQISSGRSPVEYLSTICSAFNQAPEECDEELSSESLSPGFGYYEGTDTGAQC